MAAHRLVLITGVGTEIGKTHVATALVGAWGAHEPVAGYKPIESGVTGPVGPDEAALEAVSTFHVKRPLLHVRLHAPVSPHLAARLEGRAVSLAEVAREVEGVRGEGHVVVELPGGLFSPLSDTATNADLAALLAADVVVVVAPDRLGVLHDVKALTEACRARGLRLDGVVLSAPAEPDASTGTNAAEIALTSGLPILAALPRAPVAQLVRSGGLDRLVLLSRGTTKDASLE